MCFSGSKPKGVRSRDSWSRHDRSLDFGAAIHQLLKDAVKLVQVRVAGDELVSLEPSAGDQIKRFAADCRRVVKGGAHGDVAVMNTIGIEHDVGSDCASAEEVHGAAFANQLQR